MNTMPSRLPDLLATPIGDEEIIYQPLTPPRVHLLSPILAFLWHRCDGARDREEVEQELSRQFQVPAEVSRALLDQGIQQLHQEKLLSEESPGAVLAGLSRRKFLRRFGSWAALFPVIQSVTAPQAAHAASGNCLDAGVSEDDSCLAVLGRSGPTRCCNCGANRDGCPDPTRFCMGLYQIREGGSCLSEYQGVIQCLSENGGDIQLSCSAARAAAIASYTDEAEAAALGAIYNCCQCSG